MTQSSHQSWIVLCHFWGLEPQRKSFWSQSDLFVRVCPVYTQRQTPKPKFHRASKPFMVPNSCYFNFRIAFKRILQVVNWDIKLTNAVSNLSFWGSLKLWNHSWVHRSCFDFLPHLMYLPSKEAEHINWRKTTLKALESSYQNHGFKALHDLDLWVRVFACECMCFASW